MKTIRLPAGIHRLEAITEPTTIIGDGPLWSTILTAPPDFPVVNVRAPVTVENCQLFGGQFCVKGHSDVLVPIVVRQCWLHHSTMSGIFSMAELEVDHCLIEFCGSSEQFDHGIYTISNTTIQNSILWGNSGLQFTVSNAERLRVEDCLVVGRRSYYLSNMGDVRFESITMEGRKDTVNCHQVSMIGVLWTDDTGFWGMSDRNRRLYWLSDTFLDGRGCYPNYAQFGTDKPNDAAVKHAEKLWYLGYMFARDGIWQHLPHFPGDPLPVAEEKS